LGGVPAYSTLGYFDDPILNTFVRYPDFEVARLIFHELAHQVAYAPGDSTFNESFAATVEEEGVHRWITAHGNAEQTASFERLQNLRGGFLGLIKTYRGRLQALYAQALPPERLRAEKARCFADMREDYEKLKASWGGWAGYDRWFAQGPNNASIASVGLYNEDVPAFQALLRETRGDLPAFYARVRKLAKLPQEQRTAQLQQRMPRATEASVSVYSR
jgi:predicted aminopeptidase